MSLFNDFDKVHFQVLDGARGQQSLLVTQDQYEQRVMLEVRLRHGTADGNNLNQSFVASPPRFAAEALRRLADTIDPQPPEEPQRARSS